MNFKRLLSYIYPIKVYQIPSEINKNLEVTWNNGQLVLDSKNTNFSFGSLESVMRIGLNQIGKTTIEKYQSALILGVAGGSVVHLLNKEFNFKGKITGIELDPKIIEIANDYFGLNNIENLTIKMQDAEEFVTTTTEKYDLIVIDIFQDKMMPDFLFEEEFTKKLHKILSENGSILFNTIVNLGSEIERNNLYFQTASKYFTAKKIAKVEGDNELFILCG